MLPANAVSETENRRKWKWAFGFGSQEKEKAVYMKVIWLERLTGGSWGFLRVWTLRD
jgi:hypothetical protein